MSHDETASGLGAVQANRHDGSQGNGIILVVDDEQGVRRLCKLILQRFGYEVLEADCADAAKAIWKERSGNIDLLLTDYNMPGETGIQLCEWVRSESAAIRMVLMSGSASGEFGIPTSITFLPKPFTMHSLVDAVQGRLQHA